MLTATKRKKHKHVRAVIDPVCGREVTSDSEYYVDFLGDKYYFCSAKDTAEFERDPMKYVSKEKFEEARAGIHVVHEK